VIDRLYGTGPKFGWYRGMLGISSQDMDGVLFFLPFPTSSVNQIGEIPRQNNTERNISMRETLTSIKAQAMEQIA
jgi:hypothetical protein